jgi:hypothetical protein
VASLTYSTGSTRRWVMLTNVLLEAAVVPWCLKAVRARKQGKTGVLEPPTWVFINCDDPAEFSSIDGRL